MPCGTVSRNLTVDPKFIFLEAGRDVGMCLGIHIRLSRIEMGATLFKSRAILSMSASSDADSTLKQRMPAVSANSISAADLPTPEKTTLPASPPAASTRCNSPPETISSRSQTCQQFENGDVRVGFYGEAYEMVSSTEGVGPFSKCVCDCGLSRRTRVWKSAVQGLSRDCLAKREPSRTLNPLGML